MDLLPGRRQPVRLRGRLRPRAAGRARRAAIPPPAARGAAAHDDAAVYLGIMDLEAKRLDDSIAELREQTRAYAQAVIGTFAATGEFGGDPASAGRGGAGAPPGSRRRRVPAEPDPGHAVRHPPDGVPRRDAARRVQDVPEVRAAAVLLLRQVETARRCGRSWWTSGPGATRSRSGRVFSTRPGRMRPLRLGRRAAVVTQPAVAAARRARRGEPPRRRLRARRSSWCRKARRQEPPRGRAAVGRLRRPRPRPRLAGRRGRRRRHGRPGRFRRRHVQPRPAAAHGADDAAGAGRRFRRRQGRRQPPARQEPHRRVPPARRRPDRHATLRTLPEREYRTGLAEVVKYGATLDADLFAALEAGVDALRRRDASLLEAVVATCCAAKADRRAGRARGDRPAHGAELRPHVRPRVRDGGGLRPLAPRRGGGGRDGGRRPPRRAARLVGRRDVAARQEALLEGVGLPDPVRGVARARSWTRCATTRRLGTVACPSS